MNIDQLKAFHKVARTGSFTKAADELFLTQPAVSQQIKALEAAKRTVIEGYGVTVTPEIAARREIHLGLLRPIYLKDFSLWFEYYLLFLKGKIFSKASRAFIEMLANFKLLSQAENLKKQPYDPVQK